MAASASFACMGAFTKVAVPLSGVAGVVFWRSVVVAAVSLGLALQRGQSLKPRRWGLLTWRAAVGLLAMGLFFWSLGEVELGLANALLYTSPLFIALLSWPLLRERVSWLALGSAVVGGVGVVLLVQPGAVRFELGLVAGLGAGFLAGLAYVAVRQLRTSEPPERIVWFFSIFCVVFSAPFVWWTGPALSWVSVGPLLAVGLFAAAGQLAMTRAYAAEEASVVSPVTNATVVFSWLLGLGVWGESPGVWATVGMVLVVLGAVGSAQRTLGSKADVDAEAAAEADEVGLGEEGAAGLVFVLDACDAGGEEPSGAHRGEARGEVDADAGLELEVAVAAEVDEGEVEVVEAVAVDEAQEEGCGEDK